MFDYHVAKMRKSGIQRKIEQRWLSPERPQPPEDTSQVAGALGGDQLFFPFSILLTGIVGGAALVALERLRFMLLPDKMSKQSMY